MGMVRYPGRLKEQARQGVGVQSGNHLKVTAGNERQLDLHSSGASFSDLPQTRRVCLDSCCRVIMGLPTAS